MVMAATAGFARNSWHSAEEIGRNHFEEVENTKGPTWALAPIDDLTKTPSGRNLQAGEQSASHLPARSIEHNHLSASPVHS